MASCWFATAKFSTASVCLATAWQLVVVAVLRALAAVSLWALLTYTLVGATLLSPLLFYSVRNVPLKAARVLATVGSLCHSFMTRGNVVTV